MSRSVPTRGFLLTVILVLGGPALTAGVATAGVNTWTTGGPGSVTITSIAVDPEAPRVLYATGLSPDGIYRSEDGGGTWSTAGTLLGANSVAILPTNPRTILAGSWRQHGISRSLDGGASWSAVSPELLSVWSLLVDPIDPLRVFAGTDGSIARSGNGGESWDLAYQSYDADYPPSRVVESIRVAPSNPSVVYAGLNGGSVLRSLDGGNRWTEVAGTLPDLGVLAVDPTVSSSLYVGNFFGVFRSLDGGGTWTPAGLEGHDVTGIVVHPKNSSVIFASTDGDGVFRSLDAGESWSPLNEGLTNQRVIALAIDGAGRHLYAGTVLGGVFDYEIATGAVDLSVGSDGRARVLFTRADGASGGIESVGSGGSISQSGPYGPYAGWAATATATGADDLVRILWTSDDGSAALWLVGTEGNEASLRIGPVEGLTAIDVAASLPETTHVLWADAQGRAALQLVDNAGGVFTGPVYGPYPDWTAAAIADGSDGLTRLLWKRSDGAAALWLCADGGVAAAYQFGPVAGWSAADVAVGADGQTRILWSHQDGRMALWRVDNGGEPTALGPVYPPLTGFIAGRIAAGSDGLVRVLWTAEDSRAVLWTMSGDNVLLGSVTLEPDGQGTAAVPDTRIQK